MATKQEWAIRYLEILDVFTDLKTLTKEFDCRHWTPEYRALANLIHTMGREHFHTDFVTEALKDRQ